MKDFQPRRLRIVQKGMEKYSGPLQGFVFTNGVSDQAIPFFDGQRIGAHIAVVAADSASKTDLVTPAAQDLRLRNVAASDAVVTGFADGSALKINANLAADRLSREQLEEIASKDGLPGVREIARKWGRTGRSIAECIAAVIAAQEDDDRKRGVGRPVETPAVAPVVAPAEAPEEAPAPAAPEEEASSDDASEEGDAGEESAAEDVK